MGWMMLLLRSLLLLQTLLLLDSLLLLRRLVMLLQLWVMRGESERCLHATAIA